MVLIESFSYGSPFLRAKHDGTCFCLDIRSRVYNLEIRDLSFNSEFKRQVSEKLGRKKPVELLPLRPLCKTFSKLCTVTVTVSCATALVANRLQEKLPTRRDVSLCVRK